MELEDIVLKLFEVEGLKFGKFAMRTGEVSPVYVDMRVIWSYPDLVTSISEHLWKEIQNNGIEFDHICGLPYQGIPIASYLSTKYHVPMILKRQQPKTYGTGRLLEGHYKPGDRVLLLDDVLMTGSTLVDDIPLLQAEGLEVVRAVVFIDRGQGGTERVKHLTDTDTISAVTLPWILDTLHARGKLSESQHEKTLNYLRENRFDIRKYMTPTDSN